MRRNTLMLLAIAQAKRMLTIPMAMGAVVELLYLRWTITAAVPTRMGEIPKPFAATILPRAAAA